MTIHFVLVALALGLTPAQDRPSDIPPQERQILLELYQATGGPTWTVQEGWTTEAPACKWDGVWCDFTDGDPHRPFVAGLDLSHRNLRGELPSSLSKLDGLNRLDVSGNKLSGLVPEQLLRRWDNHQFEFNGTGNSFADSVMRAQVRYTSGGVLCAPQDDVDYALAVDVATGDSRFQSVRCVDARTDRTYCLIREGRVFSLDRFSRALKQLEFSTLKADFDYPFSGATHQVFVTTTATWGDGGTHSVKTYGGQGPLNAWMAQQLFLSLGDSVSWVREYRKPQCDFR